MIITIVLITFKSSDQFPMGIPNLKDRLSVFRKKIIEVISPFSLVHRWST